MARIKVWGLLIGVSLSCLGGSCQLRHEAPDIRDPVLGDLEQLDWPRIHIRKGDLHVVMALPDAERGFYQGSRFEHSPFIFRADKGPLTLFGPWFIPFQRGRGDDITGLPGEFSFENPLGYDEAKAGENFLRIGVGHVRRPNDKPYQFYNHYEIVERGTWDIVSGEDFVLSRHTVPPLAGWSYRYTKKTLLVDDSTLRIEYHLENTGQRLIDTDFYCHNFIVFNGEMVSQGDRIDILTDRDDEVLASPAQMNPASMVFKGNAVVGTAYKQTFPQPEKRIPSAIARLYHARSGTTITLSGDYPLEKLVVFVLDKAMCPEPFLRVRVEPGQSFSWIDTYRISR